MTELLFWTALVLLGITYLGYPLVTIVAARLRPRAPRAARAEPMVSVVLPVWNEARRLPARLENILALDWPKDRFEIVVASDGSDDGTAELALGYADRGVRLLPFAARRGKASVLNDAVPSARGEIVVLADARQRFDPGAVRALVAPFADPEVGAVSGELVLTEGEGTTPASEGVGVYWRYEKLIRESESLLDSMVGATGPIYAIRRALYQPIAPETVLDDVLVPMLIVRQGYRAVYARHAIAFEPVAPTATWEATRKIRTIAGNFQLFARERWLLDPWRNRLWLQTMAHKILRLAGPLLLATALGANVLLAGREPYTALLLVQAAFYAAALAGRTQRDSPRGTPLLGVPYVFCMLNWLTVVAFVRFARGRQSVLWKKAA